jgi:hypothetical protein
MGLGLLTQVGLDAIAVVCALRIVWLLAEIKKVLQACGLQIGDLSII